MTLRLHLGCHLVNLLGTQLIISLWLVVAVEAHLTAAAAVRVD
jgi:hypothetical protein